MHILNKIASIIEPKNTLSSQTNHLSTNPPPNDQKTYDLSLLQNIVGEDSTGLYEIIERFVQQMPVDLSELNLAVEHRNLAKVSSQAHRMKSNLKLFGLESIYDDLGTLEKIGRGEIQQDEEQLQQCFNKVNRILTLALRDLPKELETMNQQKKAI